jgi:molybdenum cofactor cytidylyltransferase
MNLSVALGIRRQDVITLVGGGGKTTLMFRLADELSGAGWHVVTTMTTRIFVGQMARAPAHLLLGQEDVLLRQLASALAGYLHVLVAGNMVVEQDKVNGLAPELVDRIAAAPEVNAVIVEGDGSRRLPLKAPATHEPVIPAATTILVPMAGLDAVWRPLTPEHVHRATLVAGLTGAKMGDPVTEEMIATVLAHTEGGAKGLPAGARLVPFLNKADDQIALESGRAIARSLRLRPQVDSVVIGALEGPEPAREVWTRVGAVVLAAGDAKRFGAFKQVADWRGRPLVAHAVDQALACPDLSTVVVTVGAGAAAVRAALGKRAIIVADVSDWQEGQSRSVQAGLAALQAVEPHLGAVIFLLADQPGVTPELLSALVQRHRETLAPVVAPRHNGQRGNPVLFDRSTFDQFAALAGDVGARPIIAAHAAEIAWVDWPTPDVLVDIDSPDDYRALTDGGRGEWAIHELPYGQGTNITPATRIRDAEVVPKASTSGRRRPVAPWRRRRSLVSPLRMPGGSPCRCSPSRCPADRLCR